MNQHTYFTAFGTPAVDAEKKTMTRVAMLQQGLVRGHDVWADELFVDQLVELGNQNEAGVKLRFGHPPLCQDAIGTEIGLAKNWRKEGDTAYADLEFIETPENAKKIAHIFALAETAPHLVGNSIEFECEFRTDDEGEIEYEKVEDKKYPKIGCKSLSGTAIVSDPAATPGLFSAQQRLDSKLVSKWLSENRKSIVELFKANPGLHELAMGLCFEVEGVPVEQVLAHIKGE